MKTHIFYKKFLALLIAVVLSNMLLAQETISKTIEKKIDMASNGTFYIDNKYGDIDIKGSEGDQLEITMHVSIKNKTEEEAIDLLERVQLELKVVGSLIYLNSVINETKGSSLSRYFKKANPLNSDRNNVQIDYKIRLPKTAGVEVTNKYGDVMLDSFFGNFMADVQHGDMWINNTMEQAIINLKFGKLKAKTIKKLRVTLKNAELMMKSSNNIDLNSSGSTIEIDELAYLKTVSSKDKFTLGYLDSMEGELKFSTIRIDTLGKKMQLSMKITDLSIRKIEDSYPVINIDQESSDLEIDITGTEFKFRGYYSEGVVKLPKTFSNIESKMIDKGKKLREIHAEYGNKPIGKVSVSGHKGTLVFRDASLSRVNQN